MLPAVFYRRYAIILFAEIIEITELAVPKQLCNFADCKIRVSQKVVGL